MTVCCSCIISCRISRHSDATNFPDHYINSHQRKESGKTFPVNSSGKIPKLCTIAILWSRVLKGSVDTSIILVFFCFLLFFLYLLHIYVLLHYIFQLTSAFSIPYASQNCDCKDPSPTSSPITCYLPQCTLFCPNFSCYLLYAIHIRFPWSSLWSFSHYLGFLSSSIRTTNPNNFNCFVFNLPNSSLIFLFLSPCLSHYPSLALHF